MWSRRLRTARRTLLFSPANDPTKLRNAPETGADVVVFDLEDGVAPDDKPAARETVREALADVVPANCEVCVRVNPVEMGAADDIAVALSGTAPDSVMLPKTAGVEDVDQLGALLILSAVTSRKNSPPRGGEYLHVRTANSISEAGMDCPILALVESAAGVLDAAAIAAAADALVFGAEDLVGDIGATRSQEGDEVAYARHSVVLAARAAGVTPIDTHVPNYTTMGELRRATNRAVQLGYDGKLAIHPKRCQLSTNSSRRARSESSGQNGFSRRVTGLTRRSSPSTGR